MNIGDAAARSGLPAKTIRYYESIGLIPAAARTASGYRDYGPDDVRALRFLHRSRSLGFSMDRCRELLALYRDEGRASARVRAVAAKHVEEITQKIAALEEMKSSLQELIAECRGDEHPECPILETLAGELPAPSGAARPAFRRRAARSVRRR